MPIPKPAYDLILVRWWDHADSLHHWADVSVVKKLRGGVLIESCGWLIKEEKKCLHLAFHLANHSGQTNGEYDDDVCDVMTIMKSCIVSRTLIRKARKKK